MGFTNPYPASRLTVDSTASINQSLLGFWPLTEGSGTQATDLTSNAFNGSRSTGTWTSSGIGTVANFTGISNTVFNCGNVDASGGTGITLTAWVKANPCSNARILSKDSSGTGRNYFIKVNGTNSAYSTIQVGAWADDGTLQTLDSTGYIYINTWHHIAMTWDNSTLKVFIDGQLDSSVAFAKTGPRNDASSFLAIGARHSSSEFFSGDIGNARIYDRSLSDSEIATLYNRPWEGTNYGDLWPYSPPAPSSATLSTDTAATSLMTDCVAWWPLTDGSGTTATDIVGSNNGTITNVDWLDSEVGMSSDFQTETNGDHITTGFSAAGQNEITVSLWMRNDGGSTPNTYGRLLSMGFLNALDCYINKGTNQSLSFVINNTVVYTNTPPAIGEWYHFCGVWSQSSRQELYINGSQVATTTANTSVIASGSHNVFIGGTTDGPRTFHGGIQNVRIWDRALSSDEVAILAERPFEGIEYGDAFHYDPPTPASLTPLTSDSINTNQVGWWPLTETDDYASGAADISGNANNGTKAGGVQSVSGLLGTAANFDGVNGTEITVSGLSVSQPATISLWFKTTGDGKFIDGDDSTDRIQLYFSSTYLRAYAGTVVNIGNSNEFNDDEWHHVVGVFDGSSSVFYADGVQRAASNPGSNQLSGARIGAAWNSTVVTDNVANVRVWSRALTADEVWSIYENPWLGSAYTATATAAEVLYNYIFRSQRFRRLA